jgi:type VI secretion system protein ImpI
MKLTLRIENLDYLPDGGPLEMTATDRGFEVGRDSAMDWTLPDPHRHISGRHFEVNWRQGSFWLTDVSTNGTFVYGQSMRISSPHQLSNNDRLQVGHYIIRVMIEDTAPAYAPPPPQAPSRPQMPMGGGSAWEAGPSAAPASAPEAADPWDIGAVAAPAPIPSAPRPASSLPAQFADAFIDTPQARPVPQHPVPPQRPAVQPVQGQPAYPPATYPPSGGYPQPAPPAAAMAPRSAPFSPPPQPAQPPRPVAPPVQMPPRTGGDGGLLDAICKGAGLAPGSLYHGDPQVLGEEIGRCLRIATEELMALLSARAAAKQFVKSGSRTQIGGLNNSPLKFKPTAKEAMETMFVQRHESYLSSTVAFQQGFDDIKRHQTAVYAGMQPALARLLEDISPEAIEERTPGGIVGSKKARAWETFVETWDAKTHPHENGMLDVFLAYFAEAYDEAIRKTGG